MQKNKEKQSSNQTDTLQEAKQDVNVQKKSSSPAASKQDSDETQTADFSKEKVIKNEGPASTSTSIIASKLVNKSKARIKGTWHFAKKHQKINIKARMCKLYGLVKETLKKLEKHMHKKYKKFKYKCQFCGMLYKSKNGIYKHKLYHTIGLHYRNVIKVLCFSSSIGNIQMYILILSNTSLLAKRLDVRNITGLPVHTTIMNSIIKVKF